MITNILIVIYIIISIYIFSKFINQMKDDFITNNLIQMTWTSFKGMSDQGIDTFCITYAFKYKKKLLQMI
jgi:hypothetical protein